MALMALLFGLLFAFSSAQSSLQESSPVASDMWSQAALKYEGGLLVISGLRFDGQLQAWHLPEECFAYSPWTCRAASQLDYELTRSGPGDSWTLTVAVTQQANIKSVDVWCSSCNGRSHGSDIIASLAVQSADNSSVGSTSSVALVLTNAWLPAQQARKLQQQDCSLTVAGTTHTFDGCSPASARNSGIELFYSLTPGDNGEGAALRGGLRASGQSADGWVGWGFGQFMVGSNAVIVKRDSSTGASVAGYALPNQLAAAINSAAGTFPTANTSAELDSSGDLVAVFTVSLPGSLSDLTSSPSPYIWAAGSLSSAGALQQHRMEGRETLTFPAPTGSSSPAPVPSPSPAPGNSPPVAVPAPSSPPDMAPPSTAPAPDTTTPQSCTVDFGNGTSSTLAACTSVPGLAVPYTLYWMLLTPTGSTGNSSTTRVLMALSGTLDREEGYLAVGFPAEPGQMVGATAFILQTCPSCDSGASIQDYYLGGTSDSSVQPPGRLPASDFNAVKFTSDGATMLSGSFVVDLDTAIVLAPTTNLIFSVGPLSSSGTPLQHDIHGKADFSLQSGSVTNVDTDDKASMKAAHAWLMAIGWGVLIPSGIVMARCFKELDPLWFKLHRAVQTLGFLVGVAGFGVGFAIRSSWETPYPVHRNMGVAVLSLAVVQMTALFARPDKSSSIRGFWNWGHWWLGRAAAVLAIANIYYGIINVQKLGTWAWATYTAILALIVAVAVVKDGLDVMRGRRTCGELLVGKAPACAGIDKEVARAGAIGAQSGSNGTTAAASKV